MNSPLHLLEVLFSFNLAGSERIGTVLAKALVARGWRVSIAATHVADGPMRQPLVDAGFACHGLDIERHGRFARRWAIFRLCRRLRPDVLHAQHIPMFVLCFWPAWLAGVRRFVVTEHTDYQLRTEPRIRRRLRRYARHADRITVIHDGLARYLVDDLGVPADRVTVIPNGVDCDRFAPAPRDPTLRRTLGADDDTILIACVARLHRDKDHPTLLRAFALLVADASRSRCHLALIGEGEAREAIEALVREFGLEDHVTLLGDRPDVVDLMPQFDVLVLASRTEGLPMVLLEAMACGVPCVATAVGGVPGLLADGGGELVDPGDADSLAQALARLCDDEEHRRHAGIRARERVLAGYTETDMIDAYAHELAANPVVRASIDDGLAARVKGDQG